MLLRGYNVYEWLLIRLHIFNLLEALSVLFCLELLHLLNCFIYIDVWNIILRCFFLISFILSIDLILILHYTFDGDCLVTNVIFASFTAILHIEDRQRL